MPTGSAPQKPSCTGLMNSARTAAGNRTSFTKYSGTSARNASTPSATQSSVKYAGARR